MKKLLSVTIIVFLIFNLVACGSDSSSSNKKLNIVYATVTTNLAPWTAAIAKNFEGMCKKNGWKLTIYDGQGNVATQTEQINSIISDHTADLVVLFPADSQVAVTYVNQLSEAGIPVITMCSDVVEKGQAKVKCYVGEDNRQIVNNMVDYMIKKFGAQSNKNVVCISGWQAQYDYLIREDQLRKRLKKDTNYKLLDVQYAGASRANAKTIMEKYLTAHKNIDILVCFSDEFSLGALIAIKDAHRKGITVIGHEAYQGALDAIKAGDQDMTDSVFSYDIIAKLEEVIPKVMSGQKLDYFQHSKNNVITKENVDNFKGEY